MVGFLIFAVVVVLGIIAWKMRVPILAKILGQDQSRVQRQINRRRD